MLVLKHDKYILAEAKANERGWLAKTGLARETRRGVLYSSGCVPNNVSIIGKSDTTRDIKFNVGPSLFFVLAYLFFL